MNDGYVPPYGTMRRIEALMDKYARPIAEGTSHTIKNPSKPKKKEFSIRKNISKELDAIADVVIEEWKELPGATLKFWCNVYPISEYALRSRIKKKAPHLLKLRGRK